MLARYIQTNLGNEFYVKGERIYEPENNINEINIIYISMNNLELCFDKLNEYNQLMIYNKIMGL